MDPAPRNAKTLFFLTALHSLWKLGSPARGGDHAPAVEVSSVNRWNTREGPQIIFGRGGNLWCGGDT